MRAFTSETLRDLGYRVAEAADGEAAIAHLESAPDLDLLLTDVVMPGMNGRELADEAARRRPALKVLYMTGYSRDAMGCRGRLEAGIHIIEKPFSQKSWPPRYASASTRRIEEPSPSTRENTRNDGRFRARRHTNSMFRAIAPRPARGRVRAKDFDQR